MSHRSTRQSNITRIVRALLVMSDKDQHDLAPILDISESALSRRFSAGKWTIDDLDRMAQFFRCPMSTFFLDPADLLHTPTEQGELPTRWETDMVEAVNLHRPYDRELDFVLGA